jgi:CBS domain-containing protein
MFELEQRILMLLLLAGLLYARPRMSVWAKLGVAAAVMLALVAPPVPLGFPAAWLAAALIPLLLWQSAHRLANARWPVSRAEIAVWLFIAAAIGFMLAAVSGMRMSAALLFGVLAASILWRGTEDAPAPASHLGQVGTLALCFLLAEIAPFVESPGRYLLGLAGGAALGALCGYLFVHLARARAESGWRLAAGPVQAYVAYGLGALFGLSGVAAAALGICVYVAYGSRRGLFPDGVVRPQPLDARPVFIGAVAVLAYTGWQVHVPLTPQLLAECALGIGIGFMGIALGRRFGGSRFAGRMSYRRSLLPLGLLLLPALLVWPRETELGGIPVAAALVLAWALTLGAKGALTPLLNLYAMVDEAETTIPQPDYLAGGTRVGEIMKGDTPRVRRDAPVAEVIEKLLAGGAGCVAVTDDEGGLEGLITESDLFIKQERLPRADVSYPSLFREPVKPDRLPEVYAEIAAKSVAADIMVPCAVSVKQHHNIRHAIRVMAEYGCAHLPVIDGAGGGFRGVLTRSDIIRAFSRETKS